jgi:hypothetical protein
MIVDEGKAERFPLEPAAKSMAASPRALPTQRVNIGGLTYLQWCKTFIEENIHKNFLMGGIWEGLLVAFINATELILKSQSREHT